MIEFITKNKKSYCILDGEKISNQEVIDKMVDIILKTKKDLSNGIQRRT